MKMYEIFDVSGRFKFALTEAVVEKAAQNCADCFKEFSEEERSKGRKFDGDHVVGDIEEDGFTFRISRGDRLRVSDVTPEPSRGVMRTPGF